MTTLKGIFPEIKSTRQKNFIRENVQNLRKMEQYFQLNKELNGICKCEKTSEKFQNVAPRVHTCLSLKKVKLAKKVEVPRKTSAPVFSKRICESQKVSSKEPKSRTRDKRDKNKFNSSKEIEHRLCKSTSELNLRHANEIGDKHKNHESSQISYKSQSIQTLAESDMGDLYTKGVIRYPSTKCLKSKDEFEAKSEQGLVSERKKVSTGKAEQHENRSQLQRSLSTLTSSKPRQTVASKIAEQLSNGVTPKHRMGVVPKYLKQRKEALQKEQKAKEEASSVVCPEGFILLPDEDRKETLTLLKKSYQEYVNDLNKLPIRNDTLRAQKKKVEIEKQLNKLEEGIKIFSRSKVYVALDS